MNSEQFYHKLYEENRLLIKNIIKNLMYSSFSGDVEDCVQDVFVKAIKNKKLQEHPNFEGWLVQTAKNTVLKFNKKYVTRMNREYYGVEIAIATEDFVGQFIEDQIFVQIDLKEVVPKIIESLSFAERDFYVLRYVKKLSISDINAKTGKSETALHTTNSRIRKKIIKLIKKE